MESSPLSRIAAELRNEIYALVLIAAEPIVICRPSDTRLNQHNGSATPGLLQCCRQLRRESLELYYALNHFHFQCDIWSDYACPESHIDWIHDWVDIISQNTCETSTSIVLDLGQYSEDFGQPQAWPLREKILVEQVQRVALSICYLLSRSRCASLAISSSWLLRQRLSGAEREACLEVKSLRLFGENPLSIGCDSWGRSGIYNTKIENLFDALLVGNARALLILLINTVWLYCLSNGTLTDKDLNQYRHSLASSFEFIDDQSARRMMLLVPEDFRGYPV